VLARIGLGLTSAFWGVTLAVGEAAISLYQPSLFMAAVEHEWRRFLHPPGRAANRRGHRIAEHPGRRDLGDVRVSRGRQGRSFFQVTSLLP
jgi:hypothetical protein